ncbi:oligosaccharide flippase family protein [Chryseobacterium oranimense]|uniref:Polysaccharide transporter, PST family n=1 Tax=Chryseobacterium oranimense TaxID=421058 RepID=A0A1M5JJP8_9FLAO|nr:oligosaccharide flippase family protein [Chryseobacterium oranimense]SHG40500.1 polysaccharide transporter, PST family [Chryseobacterium oranimense]
MVNRIKKIFNTKDKKALLENFVSLSALQLIGMLLPLVTLPYILRVIGFEKYGVIVFSASLIAYFTALTDFSFRITATRDVAIYRDSPKKLNIIYSKVLTIKTLFLLLSWLIIAIAVFLYPPFYENKEIYFYTSLLLLGYVLFPEWFFQGIEKMRYITYLNLGIKLFFTLCVFIFIKKESDFWIYPLLQSAGYVGAGLVGQYVLVKKYKLKFIFLPYKLIIKTIKTNSPIFINQFVPNLYNNTSTFLLGILGTPKLVGIYQAILTVVNLIVTLIEILSRVFFPFLNRKKDAFQWYKNMMLITISIMIIGVLVFNKLIFWYLNVNYENAFWILLILAIGLFGYTLYNIFGLNYFIVHRQDKLVMTNTLFASVLGFILAYPLIHFYSVLGAAINLSLARCIMGGGLFYKFFRKKK